MENGTFRANLVAVELSRRGTERAEFLISANAGEEAKPLRQVASGGEISRIMLALKVVFAETDPVPSLIFDEIDSGIGGAVANHVAQALAKLAANHQVICVTHLAQIAATAGAHYHVAKTTERKRTQTCVLEVRGEARVEEVARLLDGKLSGASLEHARTLLSMQRRASA